MNKYEIILYWSEPDHAFIGEVPELPGCAADGPTRQEAIANAEVIIQEWMETAKELGRPIPELKRRGHRLIVRARSSCRLSISGLTNFD